MSDSIKDKISTDLNKAQSEGKLRSERIREIVKSAISEVTSEFKGGSQDIRGIVKDVVGTVLETVKDKGDQVQDHVTASIEGVIEGISQTKRQSISKTQAEVQQLEAQLDQQEQELEENIDLALKDIEEAGTNQSEQVKAAIASAVQTVKDSEEVSLMKKRYAQMKAQLAIIRANLAEQYGDQYDGVKHYLDDAKIWYDKAKNNPEVVTTKVELKQKEFESKLSEAGTAIAQKEKQIKHRLRDLWKSISEAFTHHKSEH